MLFTAMNTVLKSLKLSPGDKFLTDSHNFPAVRETLKFICNEESGKVKSSKFVTA